MSKPDYLAMLYAALAAEIGVCVETDNREGLRRKLYIARRDSRDPELDGLSLILSPENESHVWIMHNGTTGR
jgi:hypothetical protein